MLDDADPKRMQFRLLTPNPNYIRDACISLAITPPLIRYLAPMGEGLWSL